MGLFRSVLHPREQEPKKQMPPKPNGPPTPPSEPTSPIFDDNKNFRYVSSMPMANDSVTRTPSSSSNQSAHTISARSQNTQQPRYLQHLDGTHTHCIRWTPPNKLSSSLQNLAVGLGKGFKLPLRGEKKTPEAVQKERAAVNAELKRTADNDVCLSAKWGTCQEVIGKGAFGVVRIVHRADPSGHEYAVKEFRRKSLESTKQYVKRLTSEFCISSILHHPNVIETLDLLPLNETSPVYCQVMEYCDGGDLFNVIYDFASSGLQVGEANCFFKQLLRGVSYMHSQGIAHRDLKPENLLLTSSGCLKISDFGGADCFQPTVQSNMVFSRGVCGSEPYIAPEMFTDSEYDPRLTDVWSCAVIYMAMRTGNHMWHVAKKGEDSNYDRYLRFRKLIEEERENAKRERLLKSNETEQDREQSIHKGRESVRRRARESGLDILEGLELGAKRLIYRMLDPNPKKRIGVPVVMENDWFKSICCCQPSS
ncbi:kinase-like domain-containing protein [Fennellomyces sp. T-0311]|nr:kinase-like domain-containing protein [Fennellomyces sp. T-0311]